MRFQLMAPPGQWPARAYAAAALALTLTAAFSPAGLAAERRGGIEIGAKGVKATAVELGGSPDRPTVKTILNAVSNTTVTTGVVKTGKYSADAIRDTAQEAGKLAKRLRDELGIPPEKIRVIGSSGLPPASNRDELINAVKIATGLPAMEFLTPCREVELNIAGLVPDAERKNAVLVDVGSGNTKGGFIGPESQGVCFSVPLGSVTYAERVKKDSPGKPFPAAASELRPTILEAPLAEQVAANPELATRPTVFLAGGAVYALTTLMHPEAISHDKVTLSASDIADYVKLLSEGANVPVPDLTKIKSPETRAAADKEVRNVLDTFTYDNLVAGAEILKALSGALKFQDKTLIFDRNGVTAWIRASISPTAIAHESGQAPPTPTRREVLKPRPEVYPSPQSPTDAP